MNHPEEISAIFDRISYGKVSMIKNDRKMRFFHGGASFVDQLLVKKPGFKNVKNKHLGMHPF